jgi:cyanophycin synthetase
MRILELKVMRGPNYWSIRRKKLIVMKLDLEMAEEFPTNRIEGFSERLESLIPTLFSHRCSVGEEGGFFQRVKEGTWLGHVVEHVALELQTLAGMECGFGRTRSVGKRGIYNVVFTYEIEEAGIYAAHAALRLVQSIADNTFYSMDDDINKLRNIFKHKSFGPSTRSIIDEAEKRNIPYLRLDNNSLVMLGQGCNQKTICASMSGHTSNVWVDLASDKEQTKQLLSDGYIPVPQGMVITEEEEIDEAINEVGFPFVVKPIDGNHGRGITTNILTKEQAVAAVHLAKKISDEVIVEQFIKGFDYRFLVVNYKLVAVAKRTPAMVIGDGNSSIEELIEKTNSDPNRGEGHEKVLTTIKIDDITQSILAKKNLALNSILKADEILYLKTAANISAGGTSEDVTDWVHPHNVFLAERIARLMHLDICGIDIVANAITVPVTRETGAVLEVNAAPGLRMHLQPAKGLGINVAEPILEMLYPKGKDSRIPIVAVTGTNGKTTTTRLIAYIAQQAGRSVGYTTTEGIYINAKEICSGDCSGPASAQIVLKDPIIDFAVLECARGGILRSGLGFDFCNTSVITNVSEDHLGLNDINTIEELAKVKAVVAESTCKDGYAILNADDDLIYEMRKELDCKIALFSIDSRNKRIREHRENGGLAAIVDKNYFTICNGKWKTRLIKITDVPLTFSGTAECMTKNILSAVLAAVSNGFKNEDIIAALQSFTPSHDLTPGRMNLFKFKNFNMMIDYVHNEGGYIEMKKYLDKVKAPMKIGIIAATGDRRDKDIRNIGYYAAQMFDQIIIRHDKNSRGRENEELTKLIIEGIKSIDPAMAITVISDEFEAIQYAMDYCVPNAFIFACADKVKDTLAFVVEKHNKENNINSNNLIPQEI